MSDSDEMSGPLLVALVALQVGLAVGPHIGYLFQYREIARTRSSAGYAPLVSLILFTSYSLRVLYYIGQMYQLALFFQAVFGIFMHGALLLKVLALQAHAHRHSALRGRAGSFLDPIRASHAVGEQDEDGEPGKPVKALRAASELPREDITHNAGTGTTMAQTIPRLRTPPRAALSLPTTLPGNNNISSGSASQLARGKTALPSVHDTSDGTAHAANVTALGALPPAALAGNDVNDDDEGEHDGDHYISAAAAAGGASLGDTSAGRLNRFFLFRWEDGLERGLLRYSPVNFLATYFVVFVSCLALVLTYYVLVLRHWHEGAALVGYVALGIEATLVVPQILRNARRQSTAGLTSMLVFTWVAGDGSKIVYFILAHQPLPFTLCGVLQLGLDFVVVWQMVHYYRNYTSAAEGVAAAPFTAVAVHEEEDAAGNDDALAQGIEDSMNAL